MLEQPLYEPQPVAEPLKEGDPFYHYEIKNWELGPRIYKILGLSAFVNILALVVVVQGSLLTMKGCDSPLVGSMCQVLDTIYVGTMLFGTDREYVDAAYDKTDLGDVDITYVDVTGLEDQKLYYPSNYWQIANPERYDPVTGQPIDQFALNQPIPGITDNNGYPPMTQFKPNPNPAGPSIFDTPQHLPKSNPNPIAGDLPAPGGNGGTVAVKKPRNRPRLGNGNVNGTAPDADQTAEVKPSPSPTVEPTGPVDPSDINTRPFKDLAMEVNKLLEQKQLDLQAPVQILATAKLGKDGKIVKGSFKANGSSSDPKLANVVTQAVAAFNDSNLLNYLKELSGKDLNFLVRQDDTQIVAAIKSQVETEDRARSIASIIQFGITLAIQKKEKGVAELEAAKDPTRAEALQNLKDDLELLKGTQVGADGKDFVVTFTAPKANVHQMIQRKLAEQKSESKQPNSGSTTLAPTDNTARK
jgi:hypothetical protein